MIPDLSVVWVIAFVILLSVILDRLLLKPMSRVMGEREGALRSARELAEASRVKAQAATDEFESRTRAARAEIYTQMDERRRAANDRRAELVAATRAAVQSSMTDATARVTAQAATARADLDSQADALASSIVERVLGRQAS